MTTIHDGSVQMVAPEALEVCQTAERNHLGLTKEEEAARRLETKIRRRERKLQQGCQLRPHVLTQEGELLRSDVKENAKRHPFLPWPTKPGDVPWHPQVRSARRLWIKTQDAEADLAASLEVQTPPDVPGGPVVVHSDDSAAVKGTVSMFDNDYDITAALPPPNTSDSRQPSMTQEAAKKVTQAAEEVPRTSTDTMMKSGASEDKEVSEANNMVIDGATVREDRKGPPYPLPSYCMSAQADGMLSELDATTSVPKPPKFGMTPRMASREGKGIFFVGDKAAPSQDVEQTDAVVLPQQSIPARPFQNVVALPAQYEASSDLDTGEVSDLDATDNTAVIVKNLVWKLDHIAAQKLDGTAAAEGEERDVLEEGEIMEVSSTSFLHAVDQKKRNRSASALTDYSHRSLEERDEKIDNLIRTARSELDGRRATPPTLSCIDRLGRRNNQSAKATGPATTDSATIGPAPAESPSVSRRSTSPRATRGETRIQAFERAKAGGLISSEMTYFDLLRLDEQDKADTKRLWRVNKRAWEEAGRPPKPPGYTHRSLYSHVYDVVKVPDVIRGPETKRPRIQAKREETLIPTTSGGHASHARVRPLGDREAVQKEQVAMATKPTSRELEVQDFIKQMSGRKGR